MNVPLIILKKHTPFHAYLVKSSYTWQLYLLNLDPFRSEKKTADWVESIANEPIVIDEDEDEALSVTSADKEKKENIFSRLESKESSAMEVDELPDLDSPEPPPPPPPPPTTAPNQEKPRKRHASGNVHFFKLLFVSECTFSWSIKQYLFVCLFVYFLYVLEL